MSKQFLIIALFLGLSVALAQIVESLQTASYALSPVAESGVSGNLQITERAEGGVRLTVSLTGIPLGGDHAVVLYRGDCGPDREPVLQLSNVNALDGDPNSSITDSEMTFETLNQGDYFLYVFQGEIGSQLLACGEVGLGTETHADSFDPAVRTTPETAPSTSSDTASDIPALGLPPGSQAAATEATPSIAEPSSTEASGPFGSLRTRSYALSPVAGSGVSGDLQVTERVEGGTRLLVSLADAAGGSHAAVLYAGDCGPDREEILRLNSVGALAATPGSSETISELSFEAITEQDHFLYIFQGEPGSSILACGEVGLGANP